MPSLSPDQSFEIMIDILDYFTEFCARNNLIYYLGFGTLLGAVRHHDVIPWDYDLDIWMPRKDFSFLESNFLNDSKTPKYFDLLSIGLTDWYCSRTARIIDKRTYNINLKPNTHDISRYICIEIYPLDNLPVDKTEQEEYIKKLYKIALDLKNLSRPYSLKLGLKFNFTTLLLHLLSSHPGLSRTKRNYLDLCANCLSDIVTQYILSSAPPHYINRCIFDISLFKPIKMLFHKKEYFVPEGFHIVLKQLYGDYMTLPPEIDIQKNMHIRNSLVFYLQEEILC